MIEIIISFGCVRILIYLTFVSRIFVCLYAKHFLVVLKCINDEFQSFLKKEKSYMARNWN